jgi:hypothetical protein
MMKKDLLSIYLLSAVLLVYCILIQFEVTVDYAVLIWMISPLLIISTVLVVLKYGKYNGPDLGEKEFGYADRMMNS